MMIGFRWMGVTAFRVGEASRPGKRENYYNGDGGRRWALLWLIRSSMPLRTARGRRWVLLCPVR